VQYRTLKPERILDTQQRLTARIAARFPGSGLSEVAAELGSIAEKAAVRAEEIRRPNVLVRGSVAALLILAGALGLWMLGTMEFRTDFKNAQSVFTLVELMLRSSVFLGAVLLFLITLETRLKRRRALDALHELRAIAHVIDMHQVAKSPEGLAAAVAGGPGADKPTARTIDDLNRYLNYCNELLAMVSKIAALYVQDFPDAPTVSAVDQVENLCSGLSRGIWQKIMILDECRVEEKPGGA
jgi:hypothetical protein